MNLSQRTRELVSADKRPWVWIKFAFAIMRPLSAATFIFGLSIMAGYYFEIEKLYRPITDGPATNPLTATCIIFLAVGNWVQSAKEYRLGILCTLTVIFFISVRLFDAVYGSQTTALITPFYSQVEKCLAAGKSNSMGINTAVMLLTVSLSQLLWFIKRPYIAQITSFIAVGIPAITFTGYLLGINQFYGQMSLTSAVLGWMLAISSLSATAEYGALNAILSPYVGGRVARLQILASGLVPLVLGYTVVASINSLNLQAFGLFVVIIIWFSILLSAVSALFLEEADHQRRENERLLYQAATEDPLTGLANRRSFFEFSRREIAHAKRNKQDLWLLMIDADHFKRINDIAGHNIGDKVLVELSKTIKDTVRDVDVVSRIGGEEFAVVLLDTNREGAERVSSTLLKRVEKLHVSGWTDNHGAVTVSIGCVPLDPELTLEDSMKRADDALYEAKVQGRNQVKIAE